MVENREGSDLHSNKTVHLVDKEKAREGEDWR